MPAAPCAELGCKRAATVYVQNGTRAVGFCIEHGREHGAEFRCERCGVFSTTVSRAVVLGHKPPPAKRTPTAQTTAHMLCPECRQRMADEQLDLFA
jgi:Zn finger protein HypA/HybF involved in hydrogenase expression